MNAKHYTHRVTWAPEDGEHVGLCAEWLSLSWLAALMATEHDVGLNRLA